MAIYDAPIREHRPAYRHVFCRLCGSALPIVNREVDYAEIPAGMMDGDPGVRPIRHIFTQRKAPWYEPSGDLPQHEEHVPRHEHLIAQLLGSTKR